MAIVIDVLDLVGNKKRLPVEAFFVDANVVIDYADPFGRSLGVSFSRQNKETTEAMHALKSQHKSLSLLASAMEYYKYIQVGYYRIITNSPKFDDLDFKYRRTSDASFSAGWTLQLKKFTRLFTKTFPLAEPKIAGTELFGDFDGTKTDFGDHVLFRNVQVMEPYRRCVFSNDADFYEYPDTIQLLTMNGSILKRATKDGKMFQE